MHEYIQASKIFNIPSRHYDGEVEVIASPPVGNDGDDSHRYPHNHKKSHSITRCAEKALCYNHSEVHCKAMWW